jgi:hypothetical protein
MILYEFTIADSLCLTMHLIQQRAEEAAKEEAEFQTQCDEGKSEWHIKSVEMQGLPVAKDDMIVYSFIVTGDLVKVNYDN